MPSNPLRSCDSKPSTNLLIASSMLSAMSLHQAHQNTPHPLVGMDQDPYRHPVALKQGVAVPPRSGLHRDALHEIL